ncbi:MAG: PIG-L family deacetylase [Clostridia bacterium]|nr:PIG-L family deacetylase [Clostridia bacterium]
MNKTCLKKVLLLLLSLMMLLSVPSALAEDDEPEAKNLTRHMRIDQGEAHTIDREKMIDAKLEETFAYAPYETVYLSWANAPQKPAHLCIQWGALPEDVLLRQSDADGAILSEETVRPLYDSIVSLSDNAAGVTIVAGRKGMSIARLALYSEGRLPAPFFPWEDTPKGMDYLLIATHPDDDVLFMGGIVPTYGAERGYVGTVAYVTVPSRKRVNEAMLGAWEMGARYRPLFLGFLDIYSMKKDYRDNRFLKETVTLALVRMLREYRPLVVFSHAQNGEYGHWQHKVVSAAVADAVRLCADPSYDAFSVERFGTWEVRKCYLHLYPENPFVMDIRTPLAACGGRTALQVAEDAFKKHASQQNGNHLVQSDTDRDAMNRFGMVYGTVEAGDDVFDHIDPSLLSSYVPPTEPPVEPTPEPTEEPTAEPTEPPTPEPTEPPAQRPDAAAPTEAPQTPEPDAKPNEWKKPVLFALLGAAVASACFLLFGRRRKRD